MVRAIEDSPSLNDYPAEQLEASYQRARRQAAKQTSIELSLFPNTYPYAVDLVLAEDCYQKVKRKIIEESADKWAFLMKVLVIANECEGCFKRIVGVLIRRTS